MKNKALLVDERDDVVVALKALAAGETVAVNGNTVELQENIPPKHKFAARRFEAGESVKMYGIIVGEALRGIPKGGLISTKNIVHAAADYSLTHGKRNWKQPDTASLSELKFDGFHRKDGRVGTANYWIVVPMVFCENRNLLTMKDAFVKELGYDRMEGYRLQVRTLAEACRNGENENAILAKSFKSANSIDSRSKLFPNVDGIKFLTHHLGCGGTRKDADDLCGLLAGYITHPNVAGATVLSLGCQNAQVETLKAEISKRDHQFEKPLFFFEQQQYSSEKRLLEDAIKHTFCGLMTADKMRRKPAPISKLTIGVECGGSDGFSGISANPAMGFCSDLLVALGGAVVLAEFPELCGVEQDLIDRCVNREIAEKFIKIQRLYAAQVRSVGSDFAFNPSPGNIRDGLITDAMKSAGAAKKGGTSQVTDVLDYPEFVTKPGLNLLCTPGGDVESTTALAGAGANIILFSTGLGTPTGNPVAPVVKISSNSELARRMPDIIDIDAGGVIRGEETIQDVGERILRYCARLAGGKVTTKAMDLDQDDFIPWKRGVSL